MKVSEITASVEQVSRMGIDVLYWRYECLFAAGYPVDDAISLAENADVDLHFAVGLLARGASVGEAIRILA